MIRSNLSLRCADRRVRAPLAGALAGVALVLVLGRQAAGADEPGVDDAVTTADPEARRLATQGLAHFQAGRYDDAIRDLDASYRITPAPGLLYNLAQAHRLKGDCAAALDFYRRFLREDPSGTVRQRSEARISEMERCVAAGRPASAPPPEPAAAVAPPPTVPAPTTAPASPLAKLDLSKPGIAASPARVASPRRTHLAIAIGGAAVALAGGSAYFATRAGQASDDVSRLYDQQVVWGPYAMGREQDGQRAATLSITLGISAAISTAIAAWMYVRR